MQLKRYAIDTNVLLYAVDASEPRKQLRAIDVIARLNLSAVLPAQLFAEFARVSMQKFRPPLPVATVLEQVRAYAQRFAVYPLTPAVVEMAVRGVRDHGFSYFAAQIWAAARLGGADTVLSEDSASGSTVGGVAFADPFGLDFDVESL